MFVEEKMFTMDAEVNRRNSCIIAYNPSDVPPVFQTKTPASLMVFSATESDGSVMNPHEEFWFEEWYKGVCGHLKDLSVTMDGLTYIYIYIYIYTHTQI